MRQKDETQDETVHENQAGLQDQELTPNRGGELLKEEDLSVGGEEAEEGAGLSPSRGFSIALATFVPTFVAIFLGIPYLAGLPMASRLPAGLKGSSTPPVVSCLAPERSLAGAPPHQPATMMPSEMPAMLSVSDFYEPPRSLSELTSEAPGSRADSRVAPTVHRAASQQPRLLTEPKPGEHKRSASTATKDLSWLPAAAFTDRNSAEQLAANIKHPGYAVAVRRDDSTSTPWVVWIGKH